MVWFYTRAVCVVSEQSFDNSVLKDGFTEASHEAAFTVLRVSGYFSKRRWLGTVALCRPLGSKLVAKLA